MEATQLAVEFGQTGGDAGDLAIALVCGGGGLDRCAQCRVEGLETLSARATFGEREELALGVLDLGFAGNFEVALDRLVDHASANVDQFAPQREIVNEAGVVDDFGSEGGGIEQVGQVSRAADLRQPPITLEMLAKRDPIGDATARDEPVQHFEDCAVGGGVKVTRFQDVGDALLGIVVEQDRAQNGHFGLQVMRQR